MQKVREAAARMKFSNNLKQLGLALHSSHDVSDGVPTIDVFTWVRGCLPRLLPFAEQDNLSNNTATPTTTCPEPGQGYGGGTHHRGITDYIVPSAPVRFAGITDGTSNTIALEHTNWST